MKKIVDAFDKAIKSATSSTETKIVWDSVPNQSFLDHVEALIAQVCIGLSGQELEAVHNLEAHLGYKNYID